MAKLKLDEKQGYEYFINEEGGRSVAYTNSSEGGRKFAAKIVAGMNWLDEMGIDPSAADPLAGYREQVCREQREACVRALDEEVIFSTFDDRRLAMLTVTNTPAPDRKAQQ